MYNIMKLKIHIRYKMTLRVDFTCRVVVVPDLKLYPRLLIFMGLLKIALIGLTFLFI